MVAGSATNRIERPEARIPAFFSFWIEPEQAATRGKPKPVHAYASIDRAHYRAWEFHLAVPSRCFPCKMRQAVGVLIRQSSVACQSLEAPPPADAETESCCARSSNCRPAKGRQERIRATTSEVNS